MVLLQKQLECICCGQTNSMLHLHWQCQVESTILNNFTSKEGGSEEIALWYS